MEDRARDADSNGGSQRPPPTRRGIMSQLRVAAEQGGR